MSIQLPNSIGAIKVYEVISSCKTIDQLTNAVSWASKVHPDGDWRILAKVKQGLLEVNEMLESEISTFNI